MTTQRQLARLRKKLSPARPQKQAGADSAKKTAAVLVPLFELEDQLHVLYTRRTDWLPSHQGEVAFPGGKADKSDADLLATALREAHEEIGLVPETVDVLGGMTPAGTMASGYSVAPFVGIISDPLGLRANPREVAEIFSVPLEVLRDPRFRGEYKYRQGGVWPAILYGEQTIWGLTMRITLSLLELLDEAKA